MRGGVRAALLSSLTLAEMTPRRLSLILGTLFAAAVHGFRAPPPLLRPRSVKLASTLSDSPQESEEERMRQDELARKKMEEHVRRVTEAKAKADAAGEPSVDRAAWKWEIRQKIWDLLEKEDLAEPPRPVHHRIPNFKGATQAAQRFSTLPEYQEAGCVKCNPDTPQKQLRYVTLRDNKLLLVPQPRLRTGFFSKLAASEIPREDLLFACTSQGVKQYGVPLGITTDEMPKVDLVVVGSVAVDPATGARLGKGEGFAELEYGMLRMLGAIDEDTPIVTTIRDEQLVDGLPTDQLLRHDVPVDIIVTPNTVIRTNTKIPKPTGIYWDLLSPEKLASIRVLQILKAKIEEETGQTLPTGPSEVLPPIAERPRRGQQAQRQVQSNVNGYYRGTQQGYSESSRPQRDYHIVLLNLAYTATTDDVRNLVADTTGMLPTFVSMRNNAEGRPSGMAYVQLSDGSKQAEAVVALTGKELLGRTVKCRAWIVKT